MRFDPRRDIDLILREQPMLERQRPLSVDAPNAYRWSIEMDDDSIELIRESLDAALLLRPPAVVISLSLRLFEEFRARGWLTIRDFEAMGDAPAYCETHLALPNWNLSEMEFSVGDDREKPATQRRALFGSPWAGY